MTDVLAFINTLFSMLAHLVSSLMGSGIFGQAVVLGPVILAILKLIFKGLFGSSGGSSASRIHSSGRSSGKTNGSVPDD